jgi:RNA polymerase sigma-70 factor (ECF subfamily)
VGYALDHAEIDVLAARVAGNDRAAFRELVERVSPHMLRYLLHKGAALADAEDITQEAWARAVPWLKRNDGSRSFVRWAFVVVRNLWIDVLRRRRKDQDLLSFLEEHVDEARLSPDVEGHSGDWQDRLMRCLDRLPDEYRRIVRLRFWEGMSLQEVADFLGISYSSAKAKCCRAVSQLQHGLGPPAAVGDHVPASAEGPASVSFLGGP